VEMDPELEEAYRQLERALYTALKDALTRGSKRLLGAYLNNLLSYPDKPFDNLPIIDPATRDLPVEEQNIIALPQELPQATTYAKERQLAELVKTEVHHGRKCFVFATYTSTKDVTVRLKEILEREGITDNHRDPAISGQAGGTGGMGELSGTTGSSGHHFQPQAGGNGT